MGDISLIKAVQEYREIFLASRNFAQRTRVEYQNDLEDLIRFLWRQNIHQVKEIGLSQLERYLAELDSRKFAGSTRKRKVVAIRSFLWYLYQERYTTVNLAKRFIPPFAEAKSPRYLTKLEYGHLLECCSSNPRDFALVQLFLQTGIKLSELVQLSTTDIEMPSQLLLDGREIGYLHVGGVKQSHTRIVPLNYKACLALGNYFRSRHLDQGEGLFVNRFGKPLGPRGVEKILSKYLLEAGINNANVQSLRHTFAIHQLLRGTNPNTLQELMGFEDAHSMNLYTSIATELMEVRQSDNSL